MDMNNCNHTDERDHRNNFHRFHRVRRLNRILGRSLRDSSVHLADERKDQRTFSLNWNQCSHLLVDSTVEVRRGMIKLVDDSSTEKNRSEHSRVRSSCHWITTQRQLNLEDI